MAFFSIQHALLLVHVTYSAIPALGTHEAAWQVDANGQVAPERVSAALMQHVAGKSITRHNATFDVADSTSQCIAASVGLVGPTTDLVMSFVSIEEECKGGRDECEAAAFSIVDKLGELTKIIITKVVPKCSPSNEPEGLDCAAQVVAEDGPYSQIGDIAKSISGRASECAGKQGGQMFICLDIGDMATRIFGLVDTILSMVEECDPMCVKKSELGRCDARCPRKAGSWTCRERVNHLRSHENYQLNASIQTVNAECCHACECSSDDFKCPPENERGTCGAYCGQWTCEERVTYLQKHKRFPIERAVDTVNLECCQDCKCSVDDIDPCNLGCTLNGETFSCGGRIEWMYKNDWKVQWNKKKAMEKGNAQCSGQCHCTEESLRMKALR